MRLFFVYLTSIFGLSVFGQQYQRDSVLANYSGYVSGFTTSPRGSYLGYSISSWETIVLDSLFNPVINFKYNALWGGGGPTFSFDDRYVAFKVYGEVDTVVIYDFQTKDKILIPTDVSGLKFIPKKAELLISWNGHFSIYDLEKKKLRKEIINVGQKPGEFHAYYALDKNTLLYTTTTKNTIEVYNQKLKKVKSYGPFPGELDNLMICDEYLVFNLEGDKGNFLYKVEIESGKGSQKIAIDEYKYIGDLDYDSASKSVLIVGTGSKSILTVNLASMSKSVLISDLVNEKHFAVHVLDQNSIVVGDYGSVVIYRKE